MQTTESIVTTERLLLREITAADAAFMLRLLNEPTFLQFIGDRGVRTLDDARRYIETVPQDSYRQFGYGLYLVALQGGQPIGICGLMCRPWLTDADIAYALLPEAEGHGYAREAGVAILRHARERLRIGRVLAIVVPDNARSIALLEKLGFRASGSLTDPRDGRALLLFAHEPAMDAT